jgi:hypothetical protein
MARPLPLRVLGELFVGAGAMAIAVSTVLPWYDFSGFEIQHIGRAEIPIPHDLSAWEAYDFADVLLVASAAVSFLGLWLERRYEQRWICGLVALLGWATAAGILFVYFRPGGLTTAIPLTAPGIGYFGGLCGCGAVLVGGLLIAASADAEPAGSS